MLKKILKTLMIITWLGFMGGAYSADNALSSERQDFNACTSSADGEITISAGGEYSSCCSKSLGYCMSCGHIACVKVDYPASQVILDSLRENQKPQKSVIAPTSRPPSLREHIKSQPSTVSPAKSANTKAAPIVKPIMEKGQIQTSPASKAMSK